MMEKRRKVKRTEKKGASHCRGRNVSPQSSLSVDDWLLAPMVMDGFFNREIFRAWVQQSLLPTIRPSDGVVMNSLAAHQVSSIRQAIEGSGAKLFYLPPYSPDLNPIEIAFSKLKSLLPKAATCCCALPMENCWKQSTSFCCRSMSTFLRSCWLYLLN